MMNALRSSVLASAVLLFYFPSIVYRDNADFFETSFPYISLLLLGCFIATTLVLWLPSLLLRPRWRDRYGVVLTSIAFVGWFIGIFLVFERGLLDGQQQLKADSVLYQWTELSCVIVALALLIYAGLKWPKLHSNAALFLILVTAGLSFITLITDKEDYRFRKAPETILRASSRKNIFVIIFDTFQSDIFNEIVAENQSLRKDLDGFTFFRKTASVAPTTYLSMPAIHSGMIYSLDQSIPKYYEEGIRKNSFLVRLDSVGYETSMINSVGPCPNGVECAGLGQLMGDFWSPVIRDVSLLIDISLYRFVPSFFKQSVYNGGKWTINAIAKVRRMGPNIEFLKQLGSRFVPTIDQPVARFIHFFITHPPAEVGADCQFVSRKRWNWENAKAQSQCAMTLFTGFLNSLKENGLYDSSLIVLMSDHGAGLSGEGESSMMAKARSLLLIKPFQKRGNLKISNKPLHIGDVPRTICQLSGDCDFQAGKSAFGEDVESRSVPFLEYTWRHKYWYTKSVPIEGIWSIHGPVDNIFSWYRQISPSEVKESALEFSAQETSGPFGFGWLRPELKDKKTIRWATDHYAQLFLPLTKRNARIEISTYTHPRNRNQLMTLYVDRSKVGEARVKDQWQVVSFNIPADSIVEPISRLTFEFKQRASAKKSPNIPVTVAFDTLKVIYD